MLQMSGPVRTGRVSALRLWVRLSAGSRRLTALVGLLVLLMVLATCLTVWNMRGLMLGDAQLDVKNLSMAIGEQTSRSIQAVDLELQATQNEILLQGVDTPEKFATMLNTASIHNMLHDQDIALPQANAFTIVAASGQLVNSSRVWPVPSTDLSDRDYFQYMRQSTSDNAYVTGPLHNRGDGTWTIYVVRRVTSPSGQFLGLLLGAVDLHYFDNFYRALAGSDDLAVVLLDREGTLLASFPKVLDVGQKVIRPDSPWFAIVASRHAGGFDAEGVLERGSRLVYSHPLHDYPLVVDVSTSRTAILGSWDRVAKIVICATLTAILCVAFLLRALVRQLQRLEEFETSLARQNASLVEIERRITHLANHDELTGLANRRAFREILSGAVVAAAAQGGGVALLHLNLDHFKLVNDTRGHGIGDKLLVEASARLNAVLGNGDALARTGGDGFSIIQRLRDPSDALEAASALAAAVLGVMEKPFEIDGLHCLVGISIGIACYPVNAIDAVALTRQADMALYQAKADGRGVFRVFELSMDERALKSFELEQGMRQAIELGHFEMNYQPVVDTNTGRIVGCEALLRWRHPLRGIVSPLDFIGLAENLGLIIPIGHFVFQAAFTEAMNWPEDISIAVNLSPVQFNDEHLIDIITATLKSSGLAPERLILEVTEGVLLEQNGRVIDIMHRLRSVGIRFNLDDFGTGHAGLGYLRQFPFDGVKIDRLFVKDIDTQPEARAIVAAVMTVCKVLNLDVIAEGVETAAQLAEIRALQCRHVQGYLTGRPQPAAEIRQLLAQGSV